VESNTDRFGRPILPKKPFELVPGPGAYDQFQREERKGGFIPESGERKIPSDKEQGVPGPCFYNPGKEPKKISYLFNAQEKWVA